MNNVRQMYSLRNKSLYHYCGIFVNKLHLVKKYIAARLTITR
jgi:hypothetical protein